MIIISLLNSKFFFLISYFLIISSPILFNLGRIQKSGGGGLSPLTQLGSNCFHSPCVDAPDVMS